MNCTKRAGQVHGVNKLYCIFICGAFCPVFNGDRMKKYLFLLLGFVAVILFAYWAGGQVARQKCNALINESSASQQRIIIEQMGSVNEKVVNTGVCDIRRILREKYTIAE